jgi:hypothetical protein
MALALGACTTSQEQFRKDPNAVSKAAICRAFVTTREFSFIQELTNELAKRQIDPQECIVMVQQQNQAAAAVVGLAIIGTAVAVCAKNNCGGPSYPSYRGNCQYDWQYDAAGKRCGRRSAYSRPGGW